jgi:hypothetical protein
MFPLRLVFNRDNEMTSEETVKLLRWHAGLESGGGRSGRSIAACTWPRGKASQELENAVADCLGALALLNVELNGSTPSSTAVRIAVLPGNLVYAMAEISRMLRDGQTQASDLEQKSRLSVAASKIETAWLAVLAGDIDDIQEHVAHEESAKS